MKLGYYLGDDDKYHDIEWIWGGEGYTVGMFNGDVKVGSIEIMELIALGQYFEKLLKLEKEDNRYAEDN